MMIKEKITFQVPEGGEGRFLPAGLRQFTEKSEQYGVKTQVEVPPQSPSSFSGWGPGVDPQRANGNKKEEEEGNGFLTRLIRSRIIYFLRPF